MKVLVFLTLFISSVFANYQKIEEIKTCSVKSTCLRGCSSEYVKVPMGFVCEHNDLVKVFDDDYTRPIETCLTDELTQVETCEIAGYEKLETFIYKIVPNSEKKAAHLEKNKKDNDLKLLMEKEKGNIAFGQEIYASIKIKNRERGLTKEQRVALISELSLIRNLLLAGDLDLALVEIQKIDTEASQVKQEDIDYVVSAINSRLGSGE